MTRKYKGRRKIRNINLELPNEIIEIIFSKLPFYNLPSCRIVCKEWNNLILTSKFEPQISISNLFFAYLNPPGNLHCLDFDSKHSKRLSSVASSNFHKLFPEHRIVTVLSSCNEFLFLLIKKYRKYYSGCILNPMTNEFFIPPIAEADKFNYYFYGLGFSRITKRYKVVRICRILNGSTTLIEIFAFGTWEWTHVAFLPGSIYFTKHVYFNGELYFFGSYENGDCVIFCLDVEEETIRQISTPQADNVQFCRIGNVGGTLYLSTASDPPFHVWKMREDSSWIKVFDCSISCSLFFVKRYDFIPKACKVHAARCSISYLKLIKICEDGKMLFAVDKSYFMLYDPTSGWIEALGDLDITRMEMFDVHQIGSFNFNSIHQILAGNG